jgi:hypothetical protein
VALRDAVHVGEHDPFNRPVLGRTDQPVTRSPIESAATVQQAKVPQLSPVIRKGDMTPKCRTVPPSRGSRLPLPLVAINETSKCVEVGIGAAFLDASAERTRKPDKRVAGSREGHDLEANRLVG